MNSKRTKHSPHNKLQRGMTIIEVLVTTLITTIGLLGIAALQTAAMRSNLDSMQRTAASGIANEVIDRIRANPSGRRANSYETSFAKTNLCNSAPATVCVDYYNQTSSSVVQSAACSGAEVAAYDAWEMSCGYDNNDDTFSSPVNFLVAPDITVDCTDADTTDGDACSDNSDHTVIITWTGIATGANRNKGAGAGNEARSLTLNARL